MERSTSKHYFECVMVDIPVDIEGGVYIENVRIVDLPVYRRVGGESWEQMCAANDGVNVDDTHVACALAGGFGLHYP